MLSKTLSYTMVPPLGQPLAAAKPRPTMSSSGVLSAKRKLFGCCNSDDIDAKLEEANERTSVYLNERYNINLEELEEKCNKQISVETSATQFYIESDSKKKSSNFPELDTKLIFVVPQKNGIKRTFRVRKAHNGDSRVPKLKINQISNNNNNNTKDNDNDSHNSEMGENGAKRMCNRRNNNGNN